MPIRHNLLRKTYLQHAPRSIAPESSEREAVFSSGSCRSGLLSFDNVAACKSGDDEQPLLTYLI